MAEIAGKGGVEYTINGKLTVTGAVTGKVSNVECITGKVSPERTIIGKVSTKDTISALISNGGAFYLDPYTTSVNNGYTGTFDEWLAEYVSYGGYVNFYIDDDGYLIGEYDPEKYRFYIFNDNLIAEVY